ncbi:hypothetical protein C0Q70_12988 [Pomacea canaliculata]|uniref:Ig-like domain-containing protein n=1 Tax=Pomacea canaliculata TaxID=400727 RepID=A0A2T7P319_POMCA|nr:hypothetical protein C0Q70_12988 [Pomacea canaliculata]
MNAVENETIIVNENSSIEMLCQADGRPTPRMSLVIIKDNNRVLSSRPAGVIQVMEETGELRYFISHIQCEDSGDYKCEVDNGVGIDSKTVKLLVLCAPRIIQTGDHIISLDIGDSERVLSVQLKSYPPPEVESVASYQTKVNDGRAYLPAYDQINAVCVENSLSPELATCNITVDNVTKADEGFYTITFRNNLGQEHFPFIIVQSGSPRRRDTKEQVPLVQITDSKGLLTLELTAYPTPHVASTTYNDSRDGASVEDTVKIVCVASKIIPAFVTCNITVVNLSHSAEGFYSVIFSNSLGNFTFVFRTIRNKNENIYERPVIREQSEDQTYSRLQVNRMMTAETLPMSGMENTGTDRVYANTTEFSVSASAIYDNVESWEATSIRKY